MTETSAREIVTRSPAALDSDRRSAFIAECAFELTVGGRSAYPPPETAAYWEHAGFICHNELLHVVTSQLRADLRGFDDYPDSALIEVLAGKARIWGCEPGLRRALARALAAVAPGPSAETDGTSSDLLEPALACLGSECRQAFLVNLFAELSLAARGLYPPAGSEASRRVADFICHNELQQELATRLRADLDGRDAGVPGEALLRALVETSRRLGCDGSLGWALARALQLVVPETRAGSRPSAEQGAGVDWGA